MRGQRHLDQFPARGLQCHFAGEQDGRDLPRADLRLAQLGAADALVAVGIHEERVEDVVAVERHEDVFVGGRLVPQELEHLQRSARRYVFFVTYRVSHPIIHRGFSA